MKKKLQSLGFTSGHAHLLLVAVAIFSVLFVSKAGISLKTLFVKADDKQTMITYEDAKNQIASQQGSSSSTDLSEEDEKQVALLDRSLDQGQVLGDDIGIGTIPTVDELYSPEQMNSIPVSNTVPTTPQSVQTYAERMLRIQSYYDTTTMFANLNGNDPELIKQSAQKAAGIIDSMQQISVPTELVEYHRYTIWYYQTITAIGNSFVTGEGDLASYTKTLFSLMNKIESIKGWVSSAYQVSL